MAVAAVAAVAVHQEVDPRNDAAEDRQLSVFFFEVCHAKSWYCQKLGCSTSSFIPEDILSHRPPTKRKGYSKPEDSNKVGDVLCIFEWNDVAPREAGLLDRVDRVDVISCEK